MSKARIILPAALAVAAAVLFTVSLELPLWQLRMEAPQYRDEEALKVEVYPHALRGDLNEIKTLNQYIGVHIPEALPQLQWLAPALLAAAGLGMVAAFLPKNARRVAGLAIPFALAFSLLAAAVQAQAQMYDIGHKRDHKTKLVGVKDFTPPLLGTSRIAQFQVKSTLGTGAWLIGLGMALQVTGALVGRRRNAAIPAQRTAAKANHTWPAALGINTQASHSK